MNYPFQGSYRIATGRAFRSISESMRETAWFLGFSSHDIPVLMAEGILKPLGHPARNGPKYFATAELEDLRRNVKWLARATDAIVSYWQAKNTRRNPELVTSEE